MVSKATHTTVKATHMPGSTPAGSTAVKNSKSLMTSTVVQKTGNAKAASKKKARQRARNKQRMVAEQAAQAKKQEKQEKKKCHGLRWTYHLGR